MVNDLFYTIQGEGPDIGRPAIFLRLSKCNLRCHFCDTEFEQGKQVDLDQIEKGIVGLAWQYNCQLLVITGGEPLLQNIIPLTRLMTNDHSITVAIETAGTVWLEGLQRYFWHDRRVNGNLIVCSPKTPLINKELLPYIGAYKYIISAGGCSLDDGLPVKSTQVPGMNSKLFRPPNDGFMVPIYVSPMDEGDEQLNKRNLNAATTIAMKHGYRLTVQLHKLAGLP